MPAARRVQLVPPDAWDEERLLAAARALVASEAPVRPGDDVGGLVVVGVEPTPGASLVEATELEVLPRPRPASAPLVDLAVLVDHSESMGEPWSAELTRLDAVKEALRPFLARPGTGVGDVTLFGYARRPRRLAGPAPSASLSVDELPGPSGGSATGAAVNAALAHLAARATPERCQAILLLTDGAGEVAELLLAAERAKRLAVPVHVIVFAPEADEVFDEVARTSGGSVQLAMLPLDIEFVHEGASP